MLKFRLLSLPVILLLLCGCTSDLLKLEEGFPCTTETTAILKRMERATDPKGIYAKTKSFHMKQVLQSSEKYKTQDTYVTETYWKAPDFLRQISFRNNEPINIIIFREGRAWNVDVNTRKSKEITGSAFNLVKAFSDMNRPGSNYSEIFKSVKADRFLDEDSGIMYYRLICQVEDETIAPYVFYIDPKTWLTERCETILYGPDGSQQLYIADSEDFVWKQGVRVPQRCTITVGGKTDTATTILYDLNIEIPMNLFDIEKPWNY